MLATEVLKIWFAGMVTIIVSRNVNNYNWPTSWTIDLPTSTNQPDAATLKEMPLIGKHFKKNIKVSFAFSKKSKMANLGANICTFILFPFRVMIHQGMIPAWGRVVVRWRPWNIAKELRAQLRSSDARCEGHGANTLANAFANAFEGTFKTCIHSFIYV